MADGLSGANANASIATMVSGWAFEQLHTGPPGAAGTANVSSVTTRMSITWGSPSAGSVTASNQPAWASWAGTNGEVLTDTSGWSLATSGTFEGSMPLSASVTVNTGDSIALTNVSISVPVAS